MAPQLKLEQADCLQFLKQQPDNSVDLILTDPPYYRFLKAAWDRQWKTREEYLQWFDEILVEYRRVLKPAGSLYVFASPYMASQVDCLIDKYFHVLNYISWRKSTGIHNKMCKEKLRAFVPQTERIIFAEQYEASKLWESKCNQINADVFEPIRQYLADALKQSGVSRKQIHEAIGSHMHRHWFTPSQWTLPSEKDYKTLQQLFNGCLNRDYNEVKQQFTLLNKDYHELKQQWQDLRRPFSVSKHVPHTDVWDFKPTPGRKGRHPCEKPLPLIEHIIRTSSRPGQVVMDTFTGSGSTAIAAHNLGRHFIGCELGEHEYQQAQERINEVCKEG